MFFIPQEGKGKHRVNLRRVKSRSNDQEIRVRESVTRGEGISTPHVRSTLRYPLLLSILWVCKFYAYCLLLRECMQKKGEKNVGKIKLYSLGPYPNAYVSFLRNQSYRSSAHMFLFVLCFLWTMLIMPSATARSLETYVLAQK